MLIRALTFALCLLLSPLASALSMDPGKDWMTADSAHFRVHYIKEQREQAERVSRAAERAWPRITTALNWEPSGLTEIVLIDQYDLSNGYSTPLPFNAIGVFLAPPDDGELLDNSNWIEMLLLHEFTHTVHLDKARGVPKILRMITGRNVYWFPNLFQPLWAVEGLAVYDESDPATGRGRLRGPAFEAWLRAESQRGFLSLREINSGGRALPTSSAYLYGAYFYDYLARQYGPEAIGKWVERYSGNPPLYPRLDSAPYAFTDKPMETLWQEFLADLTSQVKQRGEAVTRTPDTSIALTAGGKEGDKRAPLFSIDSVVAQPDGSTLAVMDDGLGETQLVRVAADGSQKEITDVNSGTRVDVSPSGQVLLIQPDICNWRYLAYDLYRMDAKGHKEQLTSCARLRRAVQVTDGIVALKQEGGNTSAVLLDAQGRQQRVLWAPAVDTNLVDLAASADGKSVSIVSKRGADWRMQQIDLTQTDATPRLLFTFDRPMHSLRRTAAGLEFIASHDGVYNVWRYAAGALVRLSNSHTGVVSAGGTQADGSLTLAVVAPGGYELRRMAAKSEFQRVAAGTAAPKPLPAEPGAPATQASAVLTAGSSYQAWKSIYPRSWFPLVTGDRGMTAIGASTFGGDALGWHQYAASAQYEVENDEPLASFEYLYREQHLFAFKRDLSARTWASNDENKVTSYDRNTQAQWLSMLPWLKLQRRVIFGVGAALDEVDRVNPQLVASRPQKDERIAAALVDYDTSNGNWWSEGTNRGQHATLLYESYKPFAKSGSDDYDGDVVRLDWRGYVPLGRTVFALRYTEAKAHGRTEPFQVGGAVDPHLQLGIALNNRDISLRGYRGDEAELTGANARVASIEWRTPIADIDRHWMVPAVGLNRISAAVFFDIGGAWDSGHSPDRYHRGAGAELLAETKLLYILPIQWRLGVARGLDEPKSTRGYVSIGRSF